MLTLHLNIAFQLSWLQKQHDKVMFYGDVPKSNIPFSHVVVFTAPTIEPV